MASCRIKDCYHASYARGFCGKHHKPLRVKPEMNIDLKKELHTEREEVKTEVFKILDSFIEWYGNGPPDEAFQADFSFSSKELKHLLNNIKMLVRDL